MGIIEVSREVSRRIYEDGIAAFRDASHPCHPFVCWQAQHGCPDFQLPEPFSGRGSSLGLVFVGLNPGFTENEPIPTAVPIENLNPDILMMQPAEDRYRCDAAGLLSPSKMWSIFIQ